MNEAKKYAEYWGANDSPLSNQELYKLMQNFADEQLKKLESKLKDEYSKGWKAGYGMAVSDEVILESKLKAVEGLLEVAVCPNHCNNGAIQVAEDDWEQCEWCGVKNELKNQ